jgi:hypothetical protein
MPAVLSELNSGCKPHEQPCFFDERFGDFTKLKTWQYGRKEKVYGV